MVDKDVVLSKVSMIRKQMSRAREISKLSKEKFLKDEDSQDIAALKLQIAIQSCIDIGNHIFAELDRGVPGSYSEIFYELSDRGIISSEMSEKMIKMVGLRNRIAHGYEDIDYEKIYDILTEHLKDFDEFVRQIISYFHF